MAKKVLQNVLKNEKTKNLNKLVKKQKVQTATAAKKLGKITKKVASQVKKAPKDVEKLAYKTTHVNPGKELNKAEAFVATTQPPPVGA